MLGCNHARLLTPFRDNAELLQEWYASHCSTSRTGRHPCRRLARWLRDGSRPRRQGHSTKEWRDDTFRGGRFPQTLLDQRSRRYLVRYYPHFASTCLALCTDSRPRYRLTLQHEKDISTFEKQRSERFPWLDGIGYSGKIPINVDAPKSKKMEW